MRKINNKFRSTENNTLKNNEILAPCDGRFSVFKLKELMKQVKTVNISELGLHDGSGFLSRLTYSDYQRVHMPYAGYLREIALYDKYVLMKFESNYFVPPTVHEREYISVVYGNNINSSREYPELVDIQPNTKLIFYVVIVGDSIVMLNTKLIKVKKVIQPGVVNKIKSIWFDQGEELSVFNCCLGSVIFITNRPMQFSSDINYNYIETYIKLNDVIGNLL